MSTEQHAKDLRSFLAEVKQRYTEELITVEREADLRFEISALLVKLDRAQYWISKGAQPSDTVASFLKKANKAVAA